MGRKRTAEDYHRTAEENGWIPGAHEEEDSVQQTKDEPSERYKQNQQARRLGITVLVGNRSYKSTSLSLSRFVV
jgi:hypothetical protein